MPYGKLPSRRVAAVLKLSCLLGAIAIALCAVQPALADPVAPFSYSETFSLFGQQPNLCPPSNPKGICAAVAAINSFIYLQNRYPDFYGTSLVPNLQNDGTDPIDAMNFGVNGWQVGTDPVRQGYYPRPGDAYNDYVATKTDWFNDFAPGTTAIESKFVGNGGLPDVGWLADAIRQGQDVEFFVKTTGFFHALTLTGVTCTGTNYSNCSITYQDPNDPAHQQTATLTVGPGGLQITDLPGSAFQGTVTITGAFAESPIPEPLTMFLAGVGLIGLATMRRRRAAA